LTDDFGALVDLAMQGEGNVALRSVIEKELLHYDILFTLERGGFLNDLVFQGGTSLRLCYGASRYSEDLDFVGGIDFSSGQLTDMADTLKDYLSRRYSLETTVKSPIDLRDGRESLGVKVDKWQISVITRPRRPDLPRQRIKIEIANLPAHAPEIRGLQRNYDFLPDGYEDILIRVESKEEILADKLIAFPVTLPTHPRHRDIWDMRWLRGQGTEVDLALVAAKVEDYGIGGYDTLLQSAADRVGAIVMDVAFQNEMSRFLPRSVVERTLGKAGFDEVLARDTRDLFLDVSERMFPH